MDLEERVAHLERLAGVNKEKVTAIVVEGIDDLLAQAKDLPPDVKVRLVEAMGFTPMGDDHDYDCIGGPGSGFRCNCVPPATVWNGPSDVDVFRKETWEDRLALSHKWTAEKSHGRRD
jgi:hypothetical protein